ncbi:hypothetical protein BH716_07005 [Lelliottia nimipressuralis]|nr:hypothetical protein BH716_07005 [Lelliottia nimipressuralis]
MPSSDKHTLADDESVKTYYIHPMAFGGTQNPGHRHVPVVHADDFEKLRARLEASENQAKQQGNIAVALFDEVTALRRNADDKAPELRAQLEEAESRITELEEWEVKLPERYEVDMCPTPHPEGEWYSREDVLAALVAAGVKVAAEAGKGE